MRVDEITLQCVTVNLQCHFNSGFEENLNWGTWEELAIHGNYNFCRMLKIRIIYKKKSIKIITGYIEIFWSYKLRKQDNNKMASNSLK